MNRPMAGVSMLTNAFDCGFQCFVKKLCSFQTSIHQIVVTGERLLGDFFNALLAEVGAKKDQKTRRYKQTNNEANELYIVE